MTVLPAFPDAEAVVMELLGSVAPTYQTLPKEITTPVIQVLRTGGVDNGITDAPQVFVACYGTGDDGYTEAKKMAEQCRQIIDAAKGGTTVMVDGQQVVIDSAGTSTSPIETPQDNPTLRRKTATYRLTYRRSW